MLQQYLEIFMKFLLLALALVSTNSFAFTSFVCKEKDSKNPRTATLEQIGNGKIIEGKKIPFKLVVIKAPTDGREIAIVELSKVGTVITEDVTLDFTANDKSVQFGIYLDELDQSWLQIGNNKSSQFVCE